MGGKAGTARAAAPTRAIESGGARRFVGKVVLVTGAGRGIGRAVAARFLDEGATVWLADRDRAALADAIDEHGRRGEAIALPMDVGREASVRAALARRPGPLHVVVNNAGVADPASGPLERVTEAAWRRVLDVNLGGAFRVAKHAASRLRAAGGGVIVNVASTRAHQSEPDTLAYAASKGGLVALTHALAVSLGPAIRVVCVSPGWIDTAAHAPRGERRPSRLSPADHAQHPAGRVGVPEDVAAAVAYLAADEAGFVTGGELIVDGGMTRKMIYR